MLELRPTCEIRDVSWSPDFTKAMIFSFECTFGRNCENYLGCYPESEVIRHPPVDLAAHCDFAERILSIPPEGR